MSGPALRHGSLNSFFPEAKYLPSSGRRRCRWSAGPIVVATLILLVMLCFCIITALPFYTRYLNPKPETRNPTPYALDPEPETRTRNLKSETGNRKHETRNTKHETRNPRPETRNPKPENPKPKPETRKQFSGFARGLTLAGGAKRGGLLFFLLHSSRA